MTNFVSNHDAEQKSAIFVDAGSFFWVASRSDMSQTHQVAIGSLRANIVPKSLPGELQLRDVRKD